MTEEAVAEAPAPKVVSPKRAELSEEQLALNEQNRMRDYFAAQKKVTIKTREDEWVQINGYTFVIKAGEKVDVPQDVATLLEESGRI